MYLDVQMCACAQSLSRVRLLRPHRLEPARLLCPWAFSRQEHWSGLPCPPPGNLPNPGISTFQADSLPSEPPGKPKNTRVGSLPLSPGDLPNPEIKPGSPALQVDSLPSEPPGKPKNTRVVNLSLFQFGFPEFCNGAWSFCHSL